MSDKERLQLEQECLLKYSKAQMIEKYIDEFEENSKLSELWCKSQQENKQLKEEIEEYKRIEQEDLKTFNNYDSILTELEECLNEYKDIKTKSKSNEFFVEIDEVLNYLQKLKEKYK